MFQFHDEGQSPYLYKFEDNQWLWFESKTLLRIDFGKQTETLQINKSNHTCDDRECVRAGAAGAGTRRSLGYHLLHPQILRLLVLCAPAVLRPQGGEHQKSVWQSVSA